MKTMIELIPLTGIQWNGTAVRLSDSRQAVEAVLGRPDFVRENSLYYFHHDLRIDFDSAAQVEFIEFLGGIDGTLQPVIYGVKAFEAGAEELLRLLEEKNQGPIMDNEHGIAYEFPNISVGIFRRRTPEDVKAMLTDGEPWAPEDLEEEKKLAAHWATIGIGKDRYYL